MHIDNLIFNFSQKNLVQYLRSKISTFKPEEEDLSHLFEDEVFEKYESIEKIGEANLNGDDLLVILSKTTDSLTEKSGKKNQYEIAKKVLKEESKDASIFVFYDDEGNFRFSLVNANYLGTKRNYSDFKRYTYFVDKNKSNKTFKNQVGECSFSSLDEIIKAFSVEPLNKLFYQEVSKAFYELIGGKISIASKKYDFTAVLELPSTPLANRKIYQEFSVRLIGRMIFCWFLKNKKSTNKLPLIPENWLQSDTVEILSNGGFNYYHDYLEKLFFLILNKKQDERTIYDLPDGHDIIPFLNGGLFEPHVDDFFPRDSNGVHKVAHNLRIPNEWFLKFFQVLEQFNFTIDENSLNDAEVSIDPEMLGTIFENLLAEIDPDTEKSARNSTGSFYTPREIVDYMVEQSINQYLKTKTSIVDDVALQNLYKEGGNNEFDEEQTIEILEALNVVKILDPACGSGAFPMGALHKIITILHKLDPDAVWWKDKQIKNIPNALARKYMQEHLDSKSPDYIRKLGVIQNSIYGVDLQPIATEITKLRSFLSLVIDESIYDEAENRGIEPLPNLEFKFVTANTLIGLPEDSGQQGMFEKFEELQLLEQLRGEYLQSSGKKKMDVKERFSKVQKKAFSSQNNLFADHNSRSFKLMSWNPFGDEASTWFDPQWMFGIEKFDIIIGNPPYGSIIKNNKDYFTKNYISAEGKHEIFKYFIEKGLYMLDNNAVLTYIIPDTWTSLGYFKKLRKLIIENFQIHSITKSLYNVFKSATVDTSVFFIIKDLPCEKFKLTDINFKDFSYKSIKINKDFTINLKEDDIIIKKIEESPNILNDFFEVWQGLIAYGTKSQPREYSSNEKLTEFHRRLLYGRNISKYSIEWGGEYLKFGNWLHRPRPSYIYDKPKILVQRIRNPQLKERLICALDYDKYINGTGMSNILPLNEKDSPDLHFILGLLNSKLINYWFKFYFVDVNIKPEQLRKIPIKSSIYDKEISLLVNKIMESEGIIEEVEYLKDVIDILVYKTYNLIHEEILIVAPEFKLTKEQYENYTIK